jgi:hypothetical protein
MQAWVVFETVMVSVPETVAVPPSVPAFAMKVDVYVPVCAGVGVSVTEQFKRYFSVVPFPDVEVVQAGLLEVEVGSTVPGGRLPELRVIDAG